jgi:hypothetical protein
VLTAAGGSKPARCWIPRPEDRAVGDRDRAAVTRALD